MCCVRVCVFYVYSSHSLRVREGRFFLSLCFSVFDSFWSWVFLAYLSSCLCVSLPLPITRVDCFVLVLWLSSNHLISLSIDFSYP